jgi:hypothetical protein
VFERYRESRRREREYLPVDAATEGSRSQRGPGGLSASPESVHAA